MKSNSYGHQSVMIKEFLQGFEGSHLATFFEGTVGAGGHAEAILQAHPEIATYIGCDQDPQAIQIAEKRLEKWKHKVHLIRGNFRDLDRMLLDLGIKTVDGFFLILESHLCSLIKVKKGLVL